ncbi:hypothetical protein [Shewanella marisflavi]|uniref:hypothetical protein n=1 Tax=Shewanella marisflavi TaxID=260364 RepID=UPI003AAF690D
MTPLFNLLDKLGVSKATAQNANQVRKLVDTNASIRFAQDEDTFSLTFHDDEMNHEVFEIIFDENMEFLSGSVGGDEYPQNNQAEFFEEIEERLVSIYYSL